MKRKRALSVSVVLTSSFLLADCSGSASPGAGDGDAGGLGHSVSLDSGRGTGTGTGHGTGAGTGSGTGVWPAIWFFAAEGLNSGSVNASGFQGAEVDLVEPQGQITPGWVSMHMRQSGDAPNPNYQVDGSSDVGGYGFYGYPITVNVWATYGFDWQTTGLTFYLNGAKVAEETNATVLSYFNQAKMGFRLDYTMESGTDDATNPVTVSVDYIREWASFAASGS